MGQHLDAAGAAMVPPPLDVCPELTDDDVAWLNTQLALTGSPAVRYARAVPAPPCAALRLPTEPIR